MLILIYIGHFKAGFTSAVNFVLKDRSIVSKSMIYREIDLTVETILDRFKFTIVGNPYDRDES